MNQISEAVLNINQTVNLSSISVGVLAGTKYIQQGLRHVLMKVLFTNLKEQGYLGHIRTDNKRQPLPSVSRGGGEGGTHTIVPEPS